MIMRGERQLRIGQISTWPMVFGLLLLLTASWGAGVEMSVDCDKPIGRIRPLHGNNAGPIHSGEMIDLSAFHREIAIPHTRLHDVHWPNSDVVDIHTIFPDFKADPERPESYDFSRTDDYLAATVRTGAQIVYRLGESIEHTKKKYYVHPPASAEKWAAICAGIIRHYNDGWAGGFRHGIRYWEIWNEPENRPAMWTGTDEDYLKLYEVTATTLKARWPELKVGGPALGYSGKLVDGKFKPSEFMLKFLERCRERSIPLDFFSWHLYTNDPYECVLRAKGVRGVLDRNGFEKAELHFNEWNYLPDNDWGPMMLAGQGQLRERFYERMLGLPGTVFTAGVLINLQDSPVDVANYYSADIQGFGLFSQNGTPKKAFDAFRAFKMLLDNPVRVQTSGADGRRAAICAGMNAAKSQLGILVSNPQEEGFSITIEHLPWDGACQVFSVDASHELRKIREVRLTAGKAIIEETTKAPGVWFFKISR